MIYHQHGRDVLREAESRKACEILGADIDAWEKVRCARGLRWQDIYRWVSAGFFIPPREIWLDIGLLATMQLIPQKEFQHSAIVLEEQNDGKQ